MEKRHFKVIEALRWGFNTFFDQIIFFLVVGLILLGLYLAVVGVALVSMSLLAQHMSDDNPMIIIGSGLLIVVSSLLFIWFLLGLMKIMLDIHDYGKADLKTLFSQGHLIVPFATASLLFGLVVTLGMTFLIIPGIYLLCRYFFFNYAMVDRKLSIFEAFKESSRLTNGAIWQVLGLSIICWAMKTVLFLIFPAMLAIVYAYRQQQENMLQLPIAKE